MIIINNMSYCGQTGEWYLGFGVKLWFGFHCNHQQGVEQNDERTSLFYC